MKEFYETMRDKRENIEISRVMNDGFRYHFHQSLEIYFIMENNFSIKINGQEYLLQKYDLAIIDCFDIHGYDKNECKKSIVVIFPPSYLNFYNNYKSTNKISSNVIHSKELFESLLEIVTKYVSDDRQSIVEAGSNLFFSVLMQNVTFDKEKNHNNSSIIQNVLEYLQKNFASDISVSSVAKRFGYAREHLTRLFHKYLDCSVKSYINRLRVESVAEQASSGKRITEAILNSGFQSTSSYYRLKNKSKT